MQERQTNNGIHSVHTKKEKSVNNILCEKKFFLIKLLLLKGKVYGDVNVAADYNWYP